MVGWFVVVYDVIDVFVDYVDYVVVYVYVELDVWMVCMKCG